jgi:hypothetical protein
MLSSKGRRFGIGFGFSVGNSFFWTSGWWGFCLLLCIFIILEKMVSLSFSLSTGAAEKSEEAGSC